LGHDERLDAPRLPFSVVAQLLRLCDVDVVSSWSWKRRGERTKVVFLMDYETNRPLFSILQTKSRVKGAEDDNIIAQRRQSRVATISSSSWSKIL
jgi:hypothetical protein